MQTEDEAGVTPVFGVPLSPVTPKQQKYVEKDPKHTGAAGVARDVLGTLGDFLLTRLRMPAMYAPAQQQRKLEAAYDGYKEDPDAAISRVRDVDFKTGAALAEQRTDNLRADAARATADETAQARLADAQFGRDMKTRNWASSMFYSMTGEKDPAKRADLYAKMRENVLKRASETGLDLSTELPETYQPEFIDSWIRQSVPVGTQLSQTLAERRANTAERQGDERIAVSRDNTNISRDRAETAAATAEEKAGAPKKVGEYVAEDGYKYFTYDDGTEKRSALKVKPDASSKTRKPPGATADKFVVGKKYKDAKGNVATYQGNGVFK